VNVRIGGSGLGFYESLSLIPDDGIAVPNAAAGLGNISRSFAVHNPGDAPLTAATAWPFKARTTAIEPISAHSRKSGNPGAENSAKDWVRFRGDERNERGRFQTQLISL
jgi:hypothetical protein